MTESKLQQLMAAAEEAEARYDHETAVAYYTVALELPDLSLEERYSLLNSQANAYYRWGHFQPYGHAAADLIALARQIGNERLLAQAMAIHGFQLAYYGGQNPPSKFAREAIKLAADLHDDGLRCYGHLLLAVIHYENEEVDTAFAVLQKGLKLARRSSNADALFAAVEFYAGAEAVFNRFAAAQQYAAEARTLAASSGDLNKMTLAAAKSGIAATDLAMRRRYYKDALAVATAANNQYAIADVANLMGLVSWRLGLYDSSLAYAREATASARRLQLAQHFANDLDCLGRAYLGKGMIAEARRAFEEGLAQAKDNWVTAAFHHFGLGLASLAAGEYAAAKKQMQVVLDKISFQPLQALAQAMLSTALLGLHDGENALQHSNRAVALLETTQLVQEYHTQEIWWRHYQVLQTSNSPAAFAALDNAKKTMLDAIENLSDEGLRRNYLNKVVVNRAITLAWVAQAAQRDQAANAFTEHEPIPGNLREQFQRVTEIGARLTAEHDPDSLADFIVREFVEMSGAERILLLREEHGQAVVSASFNAEDAEELARTLLDEVRQSRRPFLKHDIGQVPEGAVPEIYQRSLIALPLIAQGRLLGLLYGDMRQVFGRFDENDLQLLSMLANQAAAALDNADLVNTLEEKVAERTADLAERNNELAIINSVQKGLVAELDLSAIFEVVGEKLREVFPRDSVSLTAYDEAHDLLVPYYLWEGGQRVDLEPAPVDAFGPFGRYVIASSKPLLLNTPEDFNKLGATFWEGTTVAKSVMLVPLTINKRYIGTVTVENIERENAYTETDLRMLTTLANSMSVALENARLFKDAQDARSEAEAANESKSRFLASMSHELRTPLNAIIGFTRIVQRKTQGMIPEKQTNNLEKVKASAEHLLGLINTILDIAKIEAGRMDVINELFEVEPLVRLCLSVTKPLLRPGVKLRMDIPPDMPAVNSDKDKVKQILLNLLSNAAKFTHEGEIVVEVAQPRSDSQLFIAVRDTGIGMSEEQLGRIFEEFQQAEETTGKRYGGTGLGLPISKQLAQLLGGALTAISYPGQGSTFTLVLPLNPVFRS